jgi:hypothetical protein
MGRGGRREQGEREDLGGVDGDVEYAYGVEVVQTDTDDASEEEERERERERRRRADLDVKDSLKWPAGEGWNPL